MKQLHEHSVHGDPLIVRVAGAPHPTQEEYDGEVKEADYELLKEDGGEVEDAEEELQVRVGGRPPARREG